MFLFGVYIRHESKETSQKWGRGWQYWCLWEQVRMNVLWEARWGWDLNQIACLDRILWTSDSEAGVKTEKSRGEAGGEGECRDDVAGLLVRERRSLDILPVKKKKQSCLQVKCQEKWWLAIRICGIEVCWLFAKDVWGYQRLKIRGWSSTLFLKAGWACGIGCDPIAIQTYDTAYGF